jgi:hypothetical protein
MDHGLPGLEQQDRGAGGIWGDGQNRGDEAAKRVRVLGVATGQNLDPLAPIRGDPLPGDIARNCIYGDTSGLSSSRS